MYSVVYCIFSHMLVDKRNCLNYYFNKNLSL